MFDVPDGQEGAKTCASVGALVAWSWPAAVSKPVKLLVEPILNAPPKVAEPETLRSERVVVAPVTVRVPVMVVDLREVVPPD